MGGDAQQTAGGGKVFNQCIQNRLGTTLYLANQAQSGMHDNNPVTGDIQLGKLHKQVDFGINGILFHSASVKQATLPF